MKHLLPLLLLTTAAGCHNGFCHNEIFLLGAAVSGIPLVGAFMKNKLGNLHKNLGHDVPKCEEKCKQHK